MDFTVTVPTRNSVLPIDNRRVRAVGDPDDYAERRAREVAAPSLLVYYFVFLDQGGHAPRLARLIAAARADQEKWAAYDRAAQKYKEEWAAIKARKDVVDQGGGRYLIPRSITPPTAPAPPGDQRSTDESRRSHIAKLLSGAEPEQAAWDATRALRGAGF